MCVLHGVFYWSTKKVWSTPKMSASFFPHFETFFAKRLFTHISIRNFYISLWIDMWNGVTEIFIEILEILIWRYQSEWFQICLNVSSGKKYIISTLCHLQYQGKKQHLLFCQCHYHFLGSFCADFALNIQSGGSKYVMGLSR